MSSMSGNAWAQMRAREFEQKGDPAPSGLGDESEKVKGMLLVPCPY
jgi:hypothetical protein